MLDLKVQSVPELGVRKPYIPVIMKFILGHVFSLSWLFLSIYLSIPWLNELSMSLGKDLAIIIITGLAYIPGYLNTFQIISLLLDRQPPSKVLFPDDEVTILIACRNEEKGIALTLEKLRSQDYQGKINILLVDNGSTDMTGVVATHTAERLGLSLQVLREEKLGKNNALNYGLNFIQTTLFITLDADTLLHPKALRLIVSRFKSSPRDVCAVAGAVLVRNSRDNFWVEMQEWDYFLGIASTKRLQGLYQGTLVAQGAFSLYRTDIVRDVGGWPDAIGEDIVLTWKFLEKGWKVYFEPLSVAFTEVPIKFNHFVRQRSRWARGMIEGLRAIKPWQQPRLYTKYLTMVNLLMPYTDLIFTVAWIPGLILALFGNYTIVGPTTIFVIPLTLLSNTILYIYQKKVFKELELKIRRNRIGFIAYTLFYQIFMSPIALLGYFQELFKLKRTWK